MPLQKTSIEKFNTKHVNLYKVNKPFPKYNVMTSSKIYNNILKTTFAPRN